jgi:hypothetical protein
MTRFVFALGWLAFLTTTMVVGQDPPPATTRPAQPPAKATRPDPKGNPFGQPDRGFVPRATATRLALLEEAFELLEAQRDVRRAHIRAAEVGVRSALVSAERTEAIAKNGIVSREELDKAKLDVEAAKAQLEIRKAELKEIEVKIKYAKKRLDDAKAAGVRPVRPATPADPPPARPGRDRGDE